VVYAFGHGHIGMASGATTGRVVAELIGGRTPGIPVEPFSPGRFA
jgi:D-amino-acid dehydrogenase